VHAGADRAAARDPALRGCRSTPHGHDRLMNQERA
jgi:hypothetical protein